MTKKKTPAPDMSEPMNDDMDVLPIPDTKPLEYPSTLIYKLCDFYNKYPDYQTNIVDIFTLSRLTYMELDKFIKRPHKKVTTIYLDREPPMGGIV